MLDATSAETVVLAARGKHGMRGKGKLRPRKFLPLVEAALAKRGIALRQAHSTDDVRALIDGGAQVVINVFNELHELDEIVIPDEDLPPHFAINQLGLRNLLNNKTNLSRFYRQNNIPTPENSTLGCEGFQIYATGTGRPPGLLAANDAPAEGHHVTKFIETSRPYRGKVYRTYVRLFAFGPVLLTANVGLRPWGEEDLSVHLMDTPLDADLVNHFQTLLVDRNMDRFRALSAQLGQCLGPGVFAHDIVVEAETQDIFVCESGIKFEIGAAQDYFAPIRSQVPALGFHMEGFARAWADALIEQVQNEGAWAHV